MKHRFFATILFVFITIHGLGINTQGSNNDYILIVSSYSYSDEWGTSVAKAIQKEIESRNSNMLVNISYAGIAHTESYISGRFGMQAAFTYGKLSPTQADPSLLILIGDESWMYYRSMDLNNLWKDVPVIIVGNRPQIMKEYSAFFTGASLQDSLFIPVENSFHPIPATSIMRREDDSPTIGLIKELIPDIQQLTFLSTDNYQDKYVLYTMREQVLKQYPELTLNVIHKGNKGLNAVQDSLKTLPNNSALIVYSGEIPEESPVPVFVLNDRRLYGKFVVGGCYPKAHSYAVETVNAAFRILEGDSVKMMSSATIREENVYLNKEALIYWGMSRKASAIPATVYENIPPSFLVRHMRTVLLASLISIIIIILIILHWRDRRYRKYLLSSFERYKSLYNEYRVIYENMPMGLLLFNQEGTLLNHNPGAGFFFKTLAIKNPGEFNLLQSHLLNESSKTGIGKGIRVNELIEYGEAVFRIVLREVQEDEGKNILMIVLDQTAIEKEKQSREKFYEIFHFAMDASSLGVAQYNLIDETGFATHSWYENLGIEKVGDFTNVHANLIAEDREKVEQFLSRAGKGDTAIFSERVCIQREGTQHWARYIIQPTEYVPAEDRIIISELIMNVDDQVQREVELALALKQSKESERLKNAFVANISMDIRPPLNALIALSEELTQTQEKEERERLLTEIQHYNDILLQYVKQIIEMSKTDSETE